VRSLVLRHDTVQTTLFGSTRTWIDTCDQRYEPHPEAGTFPNVTKILPSADKLGDEKFYHHLTINAAMLLTLAQALNRADCPAPSTLNLFIPVLREDAPNNYACVAVGHGGIGALMPVYSDAGRKGVVSVYRGLLAAAQAAIGSADTRKIVVQEAVMADGEKDSL